MPDSALMTVTPSFNPPSMVASFFNCSVSFLWTPIDVGD
eukprot:CAMPEP_0203937640 /NCGR_PEP_ID=MMETSP0359-20131031/74841_1 /ASSEMBLY_ACC=CAM_ASM_000338 /TAXON_ID=268821 /ORGANISM="Scrippsiella Hangoei, Strain SHTV-5" /LENGTH=38 /DNA_ID= /DNA_START= /DNA_END= /DNA_ORIENTATION=